MSHYKAKFFESDYMGYNFIPRSPEAIYDAIAPMTFSLGSERRYSIT